MRAAFPLALAFALFAALSCQSTEAAKAQDPALCEELCQPIEPAVVEAPEEEPPAESPKGPPPLPGKALSLERLFSDPPLQGRPPMALKLSPDGKRLTFLRQSEEDSEVLDLWAMPLEGGEPRPLVKTSDLVDKAAIRLSEEERMALERKRIRQTGITSYRFCGERGDALLFPLSGDLYHVTLAEEGKPKVRRLSQDGKAKLDPKCSAKGRYVGFVMERDLYVLDLKAKRPKPRRLTRAKKKHESYGLAEFIAQEEMGRYEGFWFSPDEEHIAYTHVDEGEVSVKRRPFIFADRTEMYEQRYPAAGEANAKVRVFVEPLAKKGRKRKILLKTPKEDGYIARAGFTPKGDLYVQWQSRDQKRLLLLFGEAPRFGLRPILEEKDDAWVELHDDLRFLKDGRRFIWSSERSGRKSLYLYDLSAEGKVPIELTLGEEPVLRLVGVDEEIGRVYYERAVDRSLERHLFLVTLDGQDETQLTKEPGVHSAEWGKGGVLIERYSSFGVPPKVRLLDRTGAVLRVVDENPAEELASYARPEPSFRTVKAEDGTELNALLLPPVVREEGKRYPVLVYVYGGPTAQLVVTGWSQLYPLFVHLTQQGYGVFVVDNRGTGNRDRKFTRALKDRFGQLEVEDQKRAVREVLLKEAWVDPTRIGVFGWSYGGYVSALAILDEDTPFAAACSVAPVTDWRLYDTHYTERYIGRPQDNAEVYARASVLAKAKNLLDGKRAFFLLHGMTDDNVLFQHSLELVETLQGLSAPFRFMAYPGRAHGLSGRATQLHVWRSILGFFDEEIGPKDDERPAPPAEEVAAE